MLKINKNVNENLAGPRGCYYTMKSEFLHPNVPMTVRSKLSMAVRLENIVDDSPRGVCR
jgi:hypothetical protein